MSDYSTQTVAQLKELLKGKGLSTDGKKADLVQRLVEAGTSAPAEVEKPVETEPVVAEEVAAPVVTEEPTLTVVEPVAKEEPKVLTAEERKQLAVELLQKKVQRAIKYGDEAAAEAAKKDLARVEKFGVELGTALAAEIGLVDQSLGHGYKKKFDKKGGKDKNGGKKNKVSKDSKRRR